MTVVAVEAHLPLPADLLRLADQIMSVGVLPHDLATLQLLNNLGVASRVKRVNEVSSRDSVDSFPDAISVAVVEVLDYAPSHFLQVVLEVVPVINSVRDRSVTVGIVRVGIEPVIGVVGRSPGVNARYRGSA